MRLLVAEPVSSVMSASVEDNEVRAQPLSGQTELNYKRTVPLLRCYFNHEPITSNTEPL